MAANPLAAAARMASPASPRYGGTSFVGASHSRLTEDWVFASIRSADSEVKGDLRDLRKRSREVVRNTWMGARFQNLVSDNIIGPDGIRLQSRPLDDQGEPDQKAARVIERAWRRWSEDPALCSADGKSSWHDTEDLHVQTQSQDGESFLRLLPGFDNEFGFATQIIDADQVDEQYNRPRGDGSNEIRMGVEVDRWARPVAYHVFDAHPFDYQGAARRKRVRIPASQMVQRYQVKRPGQTRGYPWYAPILMDAKMLSALQEAELVASRMSALKTGVFEQEGSAVPDPNAAGGSGSDFLWDMEPGVWETLPPGLKAKFIDPTHPNTAFEAFGKIILRSIAAGLNISYHSLTGDLTEVSFSSIRQGTLQERDVWRRLQAREATHTHRPTFALWLRWALVMGHIDLPVREYRRLLRHDWVPRGWPWVDPEKDARSSALQIRLGLDSRTRLAAEQGRDFEEVMEEQKRERDIAEEHGIELSTDIGRGRRDPGDAGAAHRRNRSRVAAFIGNGRHHDS